MSTNNQPGFTLSELLIALGILGIIAAFSIPKILNTQRDNRYNASAHEVAAAIGEAYSLYTKSTSLTSSANAYTILP